MSDTAEHKLTIFKTFGMMSLAEMNSLRDEARERLKEEHGFDENATDDQVVGCRFCRTTLGELLDKEQYAIEAFDLDCERANLDKELEGTLYLFADLGRWNRRQRYHERLTKTLDKPHPTRPPKWSNGWILSDNLNLVLEPIAVDERHVYYDATDGNIRTEGIHHDGRNNYLFREFFRCPFKDGDARRQEGEEVVDERAFEEMLFATKTDAEWMATIMDYTKPIGHHAASIYGWPAATESEAVCAQ